MKTELHWPEYFSELAGTMFMVGFGLFVIALFWSRNSPLPEIIPNESMRRLVTGFFFAGGATAVVYSPLGQRSGGHINPSVTLAFLYQKKIHKIDALFYFAAQLVGATIGTAAVYLLLQKGAGWNDAVAVGVTRPGGGYSIAAVFMAELFITWLLMTVILVVSNNAKWMKLTGLFAGTLVMLEVWLEAPVSGTSLNLARSLGPALLTGESGYLWLYAIAPVSGSVLAAVSFSFVKPMKELICSKLYHTKRYKCHMPNCSVVAT